MSSVIPASCISGRLAINRQHRGAALARFAQERAESSAYPDHGMVTAQSLRNRFAGLVTGVVRDTVMAQVEIQARPHRSVSREPRRLHRDPLGHDARRRRPLSLLDRTVGTSSGLAWCCRRGAARRPERYAQAL